MKNYLKKWGLADSLTFELDVQKLDFAKLLRERVDIGMVSGTFGLSESFQYSPNRFIGQVGSDGFKIRRRHGVVLQKNNTAIAIGKFKEKKDKLIVETEVTSIHEVTVIFYGIVLAIVLQFILIAAMFASASNILVFPLMLMPVFLIAFVYPFFMMKHQTRTMKHDLEKEFQFLQQKINTNS